MTMKVTARLSFLSVALENALKYNSRTLSVFPCLFSKLILAKDDYTRPGAISWSNCSYIFLALGLFCCISSNKALPRSTSI
jgi:hypothetical protein